MSKKESVPAEMRISETWDKCLESTLVKTSLGFVLGAASAVVFFRHSSGRGFVAGSFTGFGAALAWVDCDVAFKKAGLSKIPSLSSRRVQVPSTQESSHSHEEEAKKSD